MAQEQTTANTGTKDADYDLRSVDGDIRQLEKADLAAEHTGGSNPAPDEGEGEVIPLGKDGAGAPEEDAADTEEVIDTEKQKPAYKV